MFGISLSVRNLIQRKGLIAKPGIFLITKTDESQKQEKLKRQRKTWVDYALSIVGGVLVGIVSNVLFAYMWKN
jgi:hypothetical protein